MVNATGEIKAVVTAKMNIIRDMVQSETKVCVNQVVAGAFVTSVLIKGTVQAPNELVL